MFDHVEFVQVPEFYRFLNGDLDIVVPDRVPDVIESLTTAFPSEAKAIHTYLRDLMALRQQITRILWPRWKRVLAGPIYPLLIRKLITFSKITVGEYLDRITADDELKLTLCTNVPYYHDDPYSLGMLYFGLAMHDIMQGFGIEGDSEMQREIRGREVTVNDHDILTELCHSNAYVGGCSGFSYTTFTRSHCQNPR